MDSKAADKVYVAIGRDSYDGFSTLQWALRKWSRPGISIVILHGEHGLRKDYVYTPLGKLHVSSVSEEKLKALEKAEVASNEKILAQYIAYCGKVKTQVIKLDKSNNEPFEQQIVEMISRLRITKLVVSLAFMKSMMWKSKTAISGSFYVLRHKPAFCELFVVCQGSLVCLRDNSDEGIKQRNHHFIRACVGKMFPQNAAYSSSVPSSSSKINGSVNQWNKWSQEIEQYANELMSLYEEGHIIESENASSPEKSIELHIPEDLDAEKRIQLIQCRIRNAEEAIQSNKNQANAAKEKTEKARWAIGICNARASELKACIDSEVARNIDLSKELDNRKEEINELRSEVDEKRKKLNSILELQKELSNKLHLSSSARARAEVQLDKAIRGRADMVQEMEELRKQRHILQRRIEFCKEKDAIGNAAMLNGFGFEFREYSAAEIVAATEDLSERLRLKSNGRWTNVYKGRLNHMTVAIKVFDRGNVRSLEEFATKAKCLSQLRHPNIVGIIGFCTELNCIAYEYMHNRSLQDALFPSERSCKRKNSSLNWHARIRIAAEICTTLAFLHKAKPKPIIHGNLEPSKILLDRYGVAKINSLKGLRSDLSVELDIRSFGNVLMQLLTGKNWEARTGSDACNGDILEHLDGEWPMGLATELYRIAMGCLSVTASMPVVEMNDVKKRADEVLGKGEYPQLLRGKVEEELSNVPGAFLCPIYKDVMKNPHLAADGFSYELEAIDEWLKSGHDTSPMTNLRLKHKLLTPNHILRSLIQDWRSKKSTATRRHLLQNP